MRTHVTQTAAHCLAHVRRFSLCTHRASAVLAALASMYASTALGLHAAVAAFATALAVGLTCFAREYLRHSVILALSTIADREISPTGAGPYEPQDTLLDCRTRTVSHRTAVVRHCRTVRQ
jgi:hypothetical protein